MTDAELGVMELKPRTSRLQVLRDGEEIVSLPASSPLQSPEL